ncbi:MAG: hypothetical protein M1830_010751 [Pleopsidium flavum]|nr:MAG: hypothetical protein M1830_010751 [Pleopsidium flavum]
MARGRVKKQPSHYPVLPFHLIRLAQLLSSMVVSGIMFYFVYHLMHGNYKVPWTFFLLLGVSLLTLITLTITILFYCCRVLNPVFNMALNLGLSVLWALSWSLLTWNMSGTLTHTCNTENWGDASGTMVCRIYKALFTFALVGFLSTVSALVLDITVRRRQASRGTYNAMQDVKLAANDPIDPYQPGGDMPAQPFDIARPYRAQQPQQFGYTVPAEQQSYDTGYHHGYGNGH